MRARDYVKITNTALLDEEEELLRRANIREKRDIATYWSIRYPLSRPKSRAIVIAELHRRLSEEK